jgi:hypothetical protein
LGAGRDGRVDPRVKPEDGDAGAGESMTLALGAFTGTGIKSWTHNLHC